MSAFLCNDSIFVAIATNVTPDSIWLTARFLKALNKLSLHVRYGDEMSEDLPTVKVAAGTVKKAKNLTPDAMVAAIDLYCYQACEFKGFWDVPAIKAVQAFRKRLVAAGADGDPSWDLIADAMAA